MQTAITDGRWLREKRGIRGTPGFLSQQALADRVGVLRTYINQIENERVDIPDPPLRNRIHAALGTTDDELRELGIIKDGTLYGVTAGSGSATGSLTQPSQPDPLAALFSDFYGSLSPRQRALMARLATTAVQLFRDDESPGEDDAGERKPRRIGH